MRLPQQKALNVATNAAAICCLHVEWRHMVDTCCTDGCRKYSWCRFRDCGSVQTRKWLRAECFLVVIGALILKTGIDAYF